MTYLTIDRGNTSAKISVWNNSDLIATERVSDAQTDDILPNFEKYDIDGVGVCSVGHVDAKLLETLRRLVDGRLLVLTPSVSLPFKVEYGNIKKLGVDRIAAAAGAFSIARQAALIVDAGTAMTLDIIDSKGNFEGGNIAPGMALRFRCLHESTARLPLVSREGALPDYGHDTETAIRCGVIRGMAAEIADMYRWVEKHKGCNLVILAGSDADLLVKALEDRNIKVSTYPDLVGKGLVEIMKYNGI